MGTSDAIDPAITTPVYGGCFCGKIRYQFRRPEVITVNCHCSMCRKTSGAPFVSWLVVPTEQFGYVKGEPTVLESSDTGTRFFCGDCGTPLVCINAEHPQWTDITLGSLDQPEAFSPTKEVYADTRLGWLKDRLENYDG
ncbi:MAG: GFA family protein [Pseudomonadota bacterium]